MSCLYVSLGVGGNYMQEWHVNSLSGAQNAFFPQTHNDLGSGWGVVGLGSIGYGFGNGFRLEAEGKDILKLETGDEMLA